MDLQIDLHSKMTIYVTSTMISPVTKTKNAVTKTAKTSKWLRLKVLLCKIQT